MVTFVKEFLDSHERLRSLIPESRRIVFPDFLTQPYRIDIEYMMMV